MNKQLDTRQRCAFIWDSLRLKVGVACVVIAAVVDGWRAPAAAPQLYPTELRAEFNRREIENDLYDEYQVRFWDSRDGLLQNHVAALAFDREGYLWVGTWVGLSRFDGRGFVNFDPTNTPELRSETISDVASAPDGALWVCTHDGVYRLQGRRFIRLGSEHGLPDDKTYSVAWEPDGTMWLCTRQGLVRMRDGKIESIQEGFKGPDDYPEYVQILPDGRRLLYSSRGNWSLATDPPALLPYPPELKRLGMVKWRDVLNPGDDGVMWFRTGRGICRWHPDTGAELVEEEPAELFMDRRLLLRDSQGAVWVASTRLGVLERWHGETRARIDLGVRHGVTSFTTMLESPNGEYWIGTGQGLILMKPRAVRTYSIRQGLPHDFVFSTTQMRDGRVAVGTRRWFALLDEAAGDMIAVRVPGLEQNTRSIIAAPDGGLWIASAHRGPAHVALDGTVSFTALQDRWRTNRNIHAFHLDDSQRLWVGHTDGLDVVDGTDVRRYDAASLPAIGEGGVRVITGMSDRSVWVGTRGGGISILEDEAVRRLSVAEGLAHAWVWALHEERPGVVWAGTFGGLSRIEGGRARTLTTKDGLRENMVHAILPDRDGNLWLTGLKGIYRIHPVEVTEYLEGRRERFAVLALNAEDGLFNAETNGEQQPAGFVARDGKLWIPTIAGVTVVQPERFRTLDTPAPPIIQRLTLDDDLIYLHGREVPGQRDFTKEEVFGPGRGRTLEIVVAAPPVELTDKAQYQVCLAGHDDDWRYLGRQNTARYTNLRPGAYKIEVRVAGHHNVWSEPFVGMQFRLRPHFYTTPWFYAGCALAVLGLGGWLHRRRLRVVSRIQALEQRAALISDRERIARDMHDDLGSRLTHISLLAELATRSPDRPARERLDELNQAARKAARAVEEIVWAANPGNDTLESLVGYLIQHAANQLNTAGVACRIDSAINWPAREVRPETRHSIFLAFKEAVNNVIKHAQATEVRLSLQLRGRDVVIRISDDGSGFNPDSGLGDQHDGLRNMRARLAGEGGEFTIQSRPGQGTTVEMSFPA